MLVIVIVIVQILVLWKLVLRSDCLFLCHGIEGQVVHALLLWEVFQFTC